MGVNPIITVKGTLPSVAIAKKRNINGNLCDAKVPWTSAKCYHSMVCTKCFAAKQFDTSDAESSTNIFSAKGVETRWSIHATCDPHYRSITESVNIEHHVALWRRRSYPE